MLIGGDFLSLMPSLMMAGDLMRGALKLAPLPIQSPVRLAGFIKPGDRPLSPAARAFLDALVGFVRDLAERGLTDITNGNSAF